MKSLPTAPQTRALFLVTFLAGIAALLGALALPFLPVKERAASLHWPDQEIHNVHAPLLSYFPETFDLSLPCQVIADRASSPGDITLFSTLPPDSPLATTRGLVVRLLGPLSERTLEIILRGHTLVHTPALSLTRPGCEKLHISSTRQSTLVTVGGDHGTLFHQPGSTLRPQIVGFYTDLSGLAEDPAVRGVQATATLDSRFLTWPSSIKLGCFLVTAVLMGISLFGIYRLDRRSFRSRTMTWKRIFRWSAADVVVVAALGVWHVIGANTADDNYIATMARASQGSEYIANYYRYFGAPDDPVGWFYQCIKFMTETGASSHWIRLPTLFVNLATWWILSRFLLPRLLRASTKFAATLALWSAAMMFVCFVFAYNNGLRPEPWIALGTVMTWACVEHALATRRMFALGLGAVSAAATLTCGPTGVMVYFTFILAVKPLARLVAGRIGTLSAALRLPRWWVGCVLVTPLVALLCTVSLWGFWRISYGAFRAATNAKIFVGPYLHWYVEMNRYQQLMGFSPDGAFSRRFPVLLLFLSLVVVSIVVWRTALVRRLGIAAASHLRLGTTRRLVGVTIAGLLCLMLTPTKPTHHFGAFAGIGAAIAAVSSVAVLTLATARTRALYAAVLLFLIGLSYTAPNDWWYPAGYGAPFRMTAIRFGVSLGTVFYYMSGLALLLAIFIHLFGGQHRWAKLLLERRLIATGVLLGCILTFVIELGATSVQAATVDYSLPSRNVSAFLGKSRCGLADAVFVDADPQRSLLSPISAAPSSSTVTNHSGQSLHGKETHGFTVTSLHDAHTARLLGYATLPDIGPTQDMVHPAPPSDPADLLGFGLDPLATPLVISGTGEDANFLGTSPPPSDGTGAVPSFEPRFLPPASLTSEWFALPPHTTVITLAAAGFFAPDTVRLEFSDDPTHPTTLGPAVAMISPDPAPGWRDLRWGEVPARATAVRVTAHLDLPGPSQWIVLTPPRAPHLVSLQDLIGRSTPVFTDWDDGFGFPCMRPFQYRDGIVEIPQFEISPDRVTDAVFRPWMDAYGGGPSGIFEALTHSVTLSSFLPHALDVDWGKVKRLTPRTSGATPDIRTHVIQRSGLAQSGPLGSGVIGSSWTTDPSKVH